MAVEVKTQKEFKSQKEIKTQKETEATDKVEGDVQYLAIVLNVISRVGCGGSVHLCRVKLVDTEKVLIRAIYGPVREGDYIQLRECVRESRKLR